jgi:hypothetical protein
MPKKLTLSLGAISDNALDMPNRIGSSNDRVVCPDMANLRCIEAIFAIPDLACRNAHFKTMRSFGSGRAPF